MSLVSRYSTLFLITAITVAMAQEAPTPQPTPVPLPTPAPEQQISINLPKATGNEIAQLYRQLTNKRVLVDSSAIAVEANIVVFGDLSDKEEAAKSFEKAMLMNGFIIVPSGENEVKIVYMHPLNANPSVGAAAEAPPFIVDENDIPDGDNVITYIMPLQHILPDPAKTTLENAVKPLHKYGSITSVTNASALLITESSSLIRKMIQIKDKIDVPSQKISTAWVSVSYADVEVLAETIQKILQPQQQGNNATARVTMNYQGRNSGNSPNQVNVQNSSTGETPAQVIPDARTNRIYLMGHPSQIEFLKTLISEFDTATDSRNMKRFELNYLTALDFMPIARDALTDRSPNAAQNQQVSQQTNRNQQTSNNTTNANNIGSVPSLLKDPTDSEAPESLIVGRTLLVADAITNSIIVQGPPQSIEVIGRLLEQIDRSGPQIMISTVFGEFRRTDSKEFGFDWLASLRKDGNFTWGGSDFNTGSGWNPSADGADPSQFSGGLSGLSFYGKFAGNLNFLLRAAMETGKFSVLSRPTIYTRNNKRAVINSGSNVPVPSNSVTGISSSGDGLTQSTNITYKDVVLQLEVIALVNNPNEVTLQVGQRNDQIAGYQKIGGTDGMDVPTVTTQTLLTTVKVPNGGTVVLGGLITKENTKQKNGIPILSDIPLIGWAFSSMENKLEERELLIFIQPTIIMTDEDGYNIQVKERSRYNIAPDVMDFAEPGAAQVVGDEGLLPQNGDYNNTRLIDHVPEPGGTQSTTSPARNTRNATQGSSQRQDSSTKKREVPSSVLRPFSPI